MRRRPKWAMRVYHWVRDGAYDTWERWVEKPVLRVLCWHLGHDPIQDHCGIPAHDHCAYCREPMPGQAESREESE